MEHWNGYPFAAIVGQDEAKRAVLIALVNPEAGGLLVSGCKGTANNRSGICRAGGQTPF